MNIDSSGQESSGQGFWSLFVQFLRAKSESENVLVIALVTCSVSLLICAFYILPRVEDAVIRMMQAEEHLAVDASLENLQKLITSRMNVLNLIANNLDSETVSFSGRERVFRQNFESSLVPSLFEKLEFYDQEGNFLFASARGSLSDQSPIVAGLSLPEWVKRNEVVWLENTSIAGTDFLKMIKTSVHGELLVAGYVPVDGIVVTEEHQKPVFFNKEDSPENWQEIEVSEDGHLLFRHLLDPWDIGVEVRADFSSASENVSNLLRISMVLMFLGLSTLFSVFVLFARDMIKAARKEQSISHRETRLVTNQLETVIDAVIHGLMISDEKGNIKSFNPAAEKLFGYSKEEVLGSNVSMLVSDTHKARHDNYIEKYLKTRESFLVGSSREVLAKHKDGHLFPVQLGLKSFHNPETDSTSFVAIVRDLTWEKTVEEEGKNYTTLLEIQKKELELSKKNLEQVLENKKVFIATISHEIRTPMNGVLGMAGLLANTQLNEEQKIFVDAIRESGDAILFLINDLLDYSKLEANRLELDEKDFIPLRLIESSVALVSTQTREKNIKLTAHIEPNVPQSLKGDQGRIRQVITNYLSNAVKFTPANGRIDLHLLCVEMKKNQVRLRVEVRDSGIGISESDQKILFSEYTQADSSISIKYGGTGLGLSISRKIAELMDGAVGVESRQGEGSNFWAEFQLELGSAVHQSMSEVTGNLAFLKVMVIDGHPLNREVMKKQLESHGIRSESYGSSFEALKELKRSVIQSDHFNVVLIDEESAEDDSVREFIAGNLKKECILVLTSVLGRRLTEAMRVGGIYLSVTKPIRESALIDIMTELAGLLVTYRSEKNDSLRKEVSQARDESLPVLDIKVLLVEQSAVSQQLIMGTMFSWGCSVELAETVESAEKLLASASWDLVIIDLSDFSQDTELCIRKLKEASGRSGNSSPPVLGVASKMNLEQKKQFLRWGVGDVMVKPLAEQAFRLKIEKLICEDGIGHARKEPQKVPSVKSDTDLSSGRNPRIRH